MKSKAVFAMLIVIAGEIPAQATLKPNPTDGTREIERFNKNYELAHQKMDTPAILATWADDGVSLLPDTEPIVGKKAITSFVESAMKGLTGFQMLKAEIAFHDIQVSGDWASEWGIEHQLLQPPGDKPVIDHYGKILLILHRQKDGTWKVQQEMWNSTPKPTE